MNTTEKFYLDGFVHGAFEDYSTADTINLFLNAIDNKSLKKGFSFQSKYPDSVDLRPSLFRYEPYFLDLLFKNNLPQLINRLTSKQLICAHIQCRKITKSIRTYSDWHRDSYFDRSGKACGQIPPVYKIIIYPDPHVLQAPQLQVIPGSHHQVFRKKWCDTLQKKFSASKKIRASSHHYLFFNVALLHKVPFEKHSDGSYRIIYSFAPSSQLAVYAGTIHQELIRAYTQQLRTINV